VSYLSSIRRLGSYYSFSFDFFRSFEVLLIIFTPTFLSLESNNVVLLLLGSLEKWIKGYSFSTIRYKLLNAGSEDLLFVDGVWGTMEIITP
jgi:hypothetical protein